MTVICRQGKQIGRCLDFILFLTVILVFLGCGKKVTEAEYFEQAQLLEQREEYDQAVESYLAIYKRFPSGDYGDQSLFRAAIIQANSQKKFSESIETHDRLLRAFPESQYAPQSLFMKGFTLANDLEDYEGAKAVYEDFMEKYPGHELVASVEWELSNLGRDINDLEFLSGDKAENTKE